MQRSHPPKLCVIVRGGGDLASGVAYRLARIDIPLVITELAQPLVVRRKVSFGEAVYEGRVTVEGVAAELVSDFSGVLHAFEHGVVPVMVDPEAQVIDEFHTRCPLTHLVLVDARMLKRFVEEAIPKVELMIGLGPGFIAGVNCQAAIETNRGHRLGRVLWNGAPEEDSGIPDKVLGIDVKRVVRAPASGVLHVHAEIGDHVEEGQIIAEVDGQPVRSMLRGVLRGMMHPGLRVPQGLKIADVDPRDDPSYCYLISEKSLAIGGGVLEALLSVQRLRPLLWG